MSSSVMWPDERPAVYPKHRGQRHPDDRLGGHGKGRHRSDIGRLAIETLEVWADRHGIDLVTVTINSDASHA